MIDEFREELEEIDAQLEQKDAEIELSQLRDVSR